jgi:NAD(P)-dependent dehydrogenase (short-subunit alcohol dehydrogenase family)
VALAPKIRVNAVAPNLMMTPWWEERKAEAEKYQQTTRFGRAHDVVDVAKAVVLMATNQSISGQTLVVDLANMFL